MHRDESSALSLATMFAVSCAVLLLEVSLTRIFSLVMWYHLTYLVISLALLGYGAAGTLLATNARLAAAEYRTTLAYLCALFAVTTVMSVVVASSFPTDPERLFEGHLEELFTIVLTHLTLAIPFFLAGTAIGLVLMRNSKSTRRLYAADLVGAGLGALFAVLVIDSLGAIAAVLLAAALPAMVASGAIMRDRTRFAHGTVTILLSGALALFLAVCGARQFHAPTAWVVSSALVIAAATAFGASRKASPLAPKLAISGLAGVLVVAAIASGWRDVIPLTISGGKELTAMEGSIAYSKWNIVNRIDVVELGPQRTNFGGRVSSNWHGEKPPLAEIFQDATAPTGILHVEGVKDAALFDAYLQGAPYRIKKDPRAVLVIGLGGGTDALIAEHARAKRIVGVDLNPVTVGLLRDRYHAFASGLFESGALEIVVSEGRHYVTTSAEKFDVIQLSGVDTFTALAAGSMVLAENYLYTEEAIRDLVGHLADGGVLSYSRWLMTPPRETLKLDVTAFAALRKLGVADPSRSFLIVAGGPIEGRWADTMIKRTPFEPAEVEAMRAWAHEMDFDIIYDPLAPGTNEFDAYLRASDAEQRRFLETYRYDVTPTTDDRPFFFQFYRWRSALHPSEVEGQGGYAPMKMPKGLLSMLLTLGEVLFLSAAFVLAPLRKKTLGWPRATVLSWMTIFACLGLGFIATEMVLMQKLSVFVGGPAYSMSVTLFSLLVFSGLGSQISKRFSIGRIFALLFVTQLALIAFLDFGVPALLFLAAPLRIAVAILAVAPLGIFMGMPFPTLLTEAGDRHTTLVPWAWGVNACATVVGSVLAVIGSLELGFDRMWAAAMAIYAVAYLAARRVTSTSA
ncbi:MAG TPA: hypothetical protein VH054_21790 [Polyangiaceae bacterium]|jgi:spermidine synthase|nr:hypothetical protein [Polyangiaceae bacterium]